MPNINSDILRWARETAGLLPEEAAQKLGINAAHGLDPVARLEELENGEVAPKRPMLVKMAKHYRRPLLTFYLPEIPTKGDRGEDFRTLPEHIEDTDAALVDAVVRDIRARQSLVRATLESADEAQALPFVGSRKRAEGVGALVGAIEETLGFEREVFRGKLQLQGSFAYLRNLAEAAGIYVLLVDNMGSWYSTISVEAFRGFALADDVAPFIAINANDSPGAWSFTLVHELAHLWLGATGVSGGSAERSIEKFCNDIASELLVPAAEIGVLKIDEKTPINDAIQSITEFAESRNVSSTMIAYKLYRAGAFSFEKFSQMKGIYRQHFLNKKAALKEKNADKAGGPPYFLVRRHRIGTALIQFAERMMHDGQLSSTKAGKVLGVGSHNVHALLEQARPNHAV